MLLHDAGAGGVAVPARAGHATCPPGSDDTPGVGWEALSPALQLALGPESGHCRLPAGSERRTGSLLDTAWFAREPSGVVVGAAHAGAACPSWLDATNTASIAWLRRRRKTRENRPERKKLPPGRSPAGRRE